MVVLRAQSDFGHAPPPQTPYSIITNLPTWANAKALRDGDPGPLSKLVHLYPRFIPMQFAAKLGQAILDKLGVEGKRALIYLNPEIWPYTQRHVTSPSRGPLRMAPDEVELRIVDIASHRVYVVVYNPEKTFGVISTWANPGIGISIRGAEMLLKGIDQLSEVSFDAEDTLPQPTWTPETNAQVVLRERIVELLRRSPIDPDGIQCSTDDVFLYPSGMAAIYYATNLLMEYRPGTAVVLGVAFHNTYHHLQDDAPRGFKHFGDVDEEGMAAFQSWLEEEKQAGRTVSYVLAEVPGNPTLETVDVARLEHLSRVYGFVLILDDTVAGFANVDVLPRCAILVTSLTKSFSGHANAMGGSGVLNPLSPHYPSLASLFGRSHRNELFSQDAEALLLGARDYLARVGTLNRNAEAMASFLERARSAPDSPVVNVQYPSLLPSKNNYDAVKRPSSQDMPSPGYGCLLTVEFDTVASAAAFYDRCGRGFYPSPHLGGHVTLVFAYNMAVFGKRPDEARYMRGVGVREEGVRISAGLESEGDLVDTLEDALAAAVEAKKKETRTDEGEKTPRLRVS